MGYKLKRIMMRPNGVEKQVYPAIRVQTFDFKNDGALDFIGYNIGYGTPDYVTGQGWKIGTDTSARQGGIKPPTSVFGGTLKSIKIYWYKPYSVSNAVGTAVGICNTNESSLIEFGRYGSPRIMINSLTSIPVTDVIGGITSEYIFEDNGHITLKLNGTAYDVGNYASSFQTIWSNQELQIEMGRWGASNPHYIRKLEITTV